MKPLYVHVQFLKLPSLPKRFSSLSFRDDPNYLQMLALAQVQAQAQQQSQQQAAQAAQAAANAQAQQASKRPRLEMSGSHAAAFAALQNAVSVTAAQQVAGSSSRSAYGLPPSSHGHPHSGHPSVSTVSHQPLPHPGAHPAAALPGLPKHSSISGVPTNLSVQPGPPGPSSHHSRPMSLQLADHHPGRGGPSSAAAVAGLPGQPLRIDTHDNNKVGIETKKSKPSSSFGIQDKNRVFVLNLHFNVRTSNNAFINGERRVEYRF